MIFKGGLLSVICRQRKCSAYTKKTKSHLQIKSEYLNQLRQTVQALNYTPHQLPKGRKDLESNREEHQAAARSLTALGGFVTAKDRP